MSLVALYYALTHGWMGYLTLYIFVAVFSLAGLRHGRAEIEQYLLWPFTSILTGVLVALSLEFASWVAESLGWLKQGTYAETIALLVLAILESYIGGRYWARKGPLPATVHGRGAAVLDGTQAQLMTQKARAKALKKGPHAQFPLTVAGVAVPPEDETKHFKFMGTTGSGKSTVMRELLHAALYRGDRAVIADPDGGYLSHFYNPKRGDVILNPFDARSAKWNLFGELRAAYDIDQLARAFIPDHGSDPTWTSYGRNFLGSVIRQAQASRITDVAELYRLLIAAPKEELRVLLQGTPAAQFLEEGSEKLFGGARSTSTDHVKCLDYVQAQTGAPFSVRDWVTSGKGVLFLPYQADQIAALKTIISIWMRLAIFQTMSLGEGDHPIWFAVDELDALGAIDGLPDALARLRKFGGRCALGLQSIAQVSTTYGNGPAQAMVENCGNTLVLRCSASEGGGTARFASRLIGEREVVRLARSSSRSSGGAMGIGTETEGHSEHHATESAVMAAEIEQLPDRAGFLKFASRPAWMRVSFPVYEIPKLAAPFKEV